MVEKLQQLSSRIGDERGFRKVPFWGGKGVADVMDAPIAAYAAQTSGKGQYFDLITDAANPNGYEAVYTGIGVLKANKELTAALQAAVQSLIDDGTYGKILAKWNLSSFGVPTATINGTKK